MTMIDGKFYDRSGMKTREECSLCTALRAERDALKEGLAEKTAEARHFYDNNKLLQKAVAEMCANQQNIGRCKYNKVECEKAGCPAAEAVE